MSSRILKGIAVAAGTGLAVGFGRGRKRQSLSMNNLPDDPTIDHATLTARLDRIEDRLAAVENANQGTHETILEATLAPYVEKLRAQLQTDMQESMNTRLTAFEESIDSKVSTRVNALEKALIDQSAVVTVLSRRAVEAEENFQRLISAVERVFEQKGIAPAGQQGVSPAAFEPFEKQLSEAMQHGPLVVPEGFRPRIVSEEETKPSRHRRPLSRL
jgi:hypothetical protein